MSEQEFEEFKQRVLEGAFRLMVEASPRSAPCGECHLQPGERCDICDAKVEDTVLGTGSPE